MRKLSLSGSSVVIAILAILCVCLLYANSRLITAARLLTAQRDSLESGRGPVIGSMMTHLNGLDLRMASSSSPSRKGTLVLVYAPDCAFCKANTAQWNTLISNSPDLRLVLADLSGGREGQGLRGLSPRNGSLSLTLAPEEQLLHNLHVTPTTLLLDRDGKVVGVWSGLLGPNHVRAIENAVESLHG